MMNRFRITACLLALCMLPLGACAEQSSAAPVPESSAEAPETTAPPAETTSAAETTETTTAAPTNAPLHRAGSTASVYALHCLHDTGQIRGIFPAGGTLALVNIINEFDREAEAVVVDMAADTVAARVQLKNLYEEVLGYTSDGKILTECYDGAPSLRFYDPKTGDHTEAEIDQSTVDEMSGIGTLRYDRATDMISTTGWNGVQILHRDGTCEPLYTLDETESSLYSLAAYAPGEGIMVMSEPDNNDSSGRAFTVRSARDGQVITTVCDLDSGAALTKSCLIRKDMIWSEDGNSYASTGLAVFDRRSGEYINRITEQNVSCDLYTDITSETAIAMNWSAEAHEALDCWLFEPQTGKRAALALPEGSHWAMYASRLPDCGSWVFGLTTEGASGYYTEVFAVDSENLVFEDSFPQGEPYGDMREYKIGDALKECRAKADRLEQALGIRILIGDEVLQVRDQSTYRLVSTEDVEAVANVYGDYYDQEQMTGEVMRALDKLETELSRYPAGFFEKFKCSGGICGLRILVTLELPNIDESSSFSAGGVHFVGRTWYNIALNTSMYGDFDMSIHHEMWHAVESLLDANGSYVNYDEWAALNPPGFDYSGLENYGEGGWDYIMDFGDNPYFTRIYGTASEMEDRATLIEGAFDYQWDDNAEKYKNGLERLKQYPHLAAKLEYLAAKVKTLFGYVYWDEMIGDRVYHGTWDESDTIY